MDIIDMNYTFREITPQNLADIVFLVKKVIGKQLSVAYYQKKYDTPQANGKYHGWLAYDAGGQPVSVAAALPTLVQLPDGQQLPATQMIETFTLPEHRGKGLMTTMVQKILDTHNAAGIGLFFGLLNQNNVHPFTKKLGFVQTHTMQYYAISTGAFPLEAIARRTGLSAWYNRWLKNRLLPYITSEDATILPNSILQEGFAGVVHDAAFFAYKKFSMNRLCQFEGIDSWLKFESGLLVGDVVLPADCDQAQFDRWLAQLVLLAKKMGLRRIFFQTFEGARLDAFLQKNYVPQPSWAPCLLGTNTEMKASLYQFRFGFADFETF
jgi:GNAT superfamily N-acetyltransferase